jgi:hypothetical protein
MAGNDMPQWYSKERMNEDRIEPINENTEAGDNAQKSENKPPVTPVDVRKVEPTEHTPSSDTEKNKRKSKPLSCFEVWTISLASIGILVAAGTGLAIYWQDKIASRTLIEIQKQYPELQKSADAADSAAKTAQDTLVDSQRPWIGIIGGLEIKNVKFIPNPVKPSELNPFALNMEISYSLENFGGSPARKVANAIIPIVSNQPDAPTSWRKMACEVAEGVSRSATVPTFFMMPKSPTPVTSLGSSGIQRDIVEVRQIWLVGCFVYQDIFEKLHHTRLLFRSKPIPNAAPNVAIPNKLTYLPVGGFEMWDSDTD